MTETVTETRTLLVGSAPDAVRVQEWIGTEGLRFCAINNAWRLSPAFDTLYLPADFADRNKPAKDFPAPITPLRMDKGGPGHSYGPETLAGPTVAFTAACAALDEGATALAWLGCDMIYDAPDGQTHFYGRGTADPLRPNPGLISHAARCNRLAWIAWRSKGVPLFRLSHGRSRLTVPSLSFEEFATLPPDLLKARFTSALRFDDAAGGAAMALEYGLVRAMASQRLKKAGQHRTFLAPHFPRLDALWEAALSPV